MKKKRELDAEVNLVAFISLLSVLICALLLTTIWIQIGSMDVKHSWGAAAAGESKKEPKISAKIAADGEVRISLRDVPRKTPRGLRIARFAPTGEGELDTEGLTAYLAQVKEKLPNLKTALIQPSGATSYEKIITLMDRFKEGGVVDLGVSPL